MADESVSESKRTLIRDRVNDRCAHRFAAGFGSVVPRKGREGRALGVRQTLWEGHPLRIATSDWSASVRRHARGRRRRDHAAERDGRSATGEALPEKRRESPFTATQARCRPECRRGRHPESSTGSYGRQDYPWQRGSGWIQKDIGNAGTASVYEILKPFKSILQFVNTRRFQNSLFL